MGASERSQNAEREERSLRLAKSYRRSFGAGIRTVASGGVRVGPARERLGGGIFEKFRALFFMVK